MRRSTLALATLLPVLTAAGAVPSAKVLERYRQLLAANPAEGTPLDRLWDAYVEMGQSETLLEEYRLQKTESGQLIHGLLLMKAGRVEDAIAKLNEASEANPTNATATLTLARLKVRAGRPAEAIAWFEKALGRLPENDARASAAWLDLGNAAASSGDLATASAAWERLAARTPGDLEMRRRLADTYLRNRLPDRAVAHLEYVVAHASPQEQAQAWQQIASIHVSRGDADAAIAALSKALRVTGPTSWLRPQLQADLVRLHERYHRVDELEKSWQRFAGENPRDLGAYLQLVDLYEQLGRPEEQLVWLERLVALAPKSVPYRLRLARLLAQMDHLDRAAEVYDRLLAADATNVDLTFERARIDVQRDHTAAAGERLAALLARGSDDGVRRRVIDFYQTHRLYELLERQLVQDAGKGTEETITALASFYFSRRRDAEARQTLERLVHPSDPPAARAAGLFRIASELKGQNDLEAACAMVRRAIELAADVRDYHFLLGEMESAAGHYAEAQAAFEHAFATSRTPEAAQEADQRLYDSLRNQREPGEEESRSASVRPESAANATSAAAQSYLLRLLREAVERPSEAAMLRVARWQQWSRNQRGAIDYAERALVLNPRSIAAHDFLARLYATDAQAAAAQAHLDQLALIDPTNRSTYLRRLGQVQIQAGVTEDALATYRRLSEANPGDLEALHDLAMAQQRADLWSEALSTLKKVYTQSPSSQKREAAMALRRVYERLEMHRPAAEMLLGQVDLEPDLHGRLTVLGELIELANRHGFMDWLRGQFEERHRLQPSDYFGEVALGRIRKAQGDKAGAFDLLADAALAAPNPEDALPELVREAEDLHRLSSAIRLQERYVRTVRQDSPEALVRLAELQEKCLLAKDAAGTWDRLVRKFPRDVPVLEKAAAFERIWGTTDKAADLLRRVRAIEPENHRALAQLAELCLGLGKPDEAESCLEQILAGLSPENPNDPIRYPATSPSDPTTVEFSFRSAVRRRSGEPSPEAIKALRTFWFDKPEAGKGTATGAFSRLELVRDLAEIVAARGDAARKEAWIRRWQKPEVGRSERLWALYFAHATGPLLDEVEKLVVSQPGDGGPVNAFIWLSLQAGELERLGHWLSRRERTPTERDFLMVSLEQYLSENHGPLPAGIAQWLYPDELGAGNWPAASSLATHGFWPSAVDLGERTLRRITTQRAGFGLELAQWKTMTGDVEGAVASLRSSLSGNSESLNSPYFAATRALYLLLPAEDRPAYLEARCAGLDAQAHPRRAVLTQMLLAALDGNTSAAQTCLDQLLSLRPLSTDVDEHATAATRRWDFILACGVQLGAWQLTDTAIYFWEKALEDQAAIALQVQQPTPDGEVVRNRVLEIRARLTALKLLRAEPDQVDGIVADYTRRTSPDALLPLAEALELFGGNARAVAIYRKLWRLEPGDPHALRNAVNACRNANDWETLEAVLTAVVTEGHFRRNLSAHRDLVHQLVEVLGARGKLSEAKARIHDITDQPPHDARALLKLADLHQRLGEPGPAEAVYRRLLSVEPGNANGRMALAGLLDQQSRTLEAIDLLERASGAEIDARLAILNVRAGRWEEALAALDRVTEADRARVSLAMADALASRSEASKAKDLLQWAGSRCQDPKMAVSLQSRLIELMPTGTPASVISDHLARLYRLVDSQGAGSSNYYSLLAREAPRLGIEKMWRTQAQTLWRDGAGDPAAGASWIASLIQDGAGKRAEEAWSILAGHPHLDGAALQTVLAALPEKDASPMRVSVLNRLAALDAANPAWLIAETKTLLSANRDRDASQRAEQLAARAVFWPEMLVPAAELAQAVGAVGRATELYRRAMTLDPMVQKPEVHAAYARLLLEAGQMSQAAETLRRMTWVSAKASVPLIVDYLRRSDRLANPEKGLAPFSVGGALRDELMVALVPACLEASQPEAALRMAGASPEVLKKSAADLLQYAQMSGRFAPVAELWETALAQGALLSGPAAELFAAWADADLAGLQTDAALAHFSRANQLNPASWPIAEKLARLNLDLKDFARAGQVLRGFLSGSPSAVDRQKAEALLARTHQP